MNTLRDILLLRTPAYEQWRDAPRTMKRGFLLLAACVLLAGSLTALIAYGSSLKPFTQDQANAIEEEFMQGMETWQQTMPQQDPGMQEFLDQFTTNFRAGIKMGVEIDALQTPLPRGVARLLQSLGAWVSGVFGSVAMWLGYGIWVLLFARLLGGQGALHRFFGLTALYALPNVLRIFEFVPAIGPLLSWIGLIWGVLVYGKAVKVSQGLSTGRAAAAILLPAVLVLVLSLIAFGIFSVLLVTAASAGS